MIWIERGIVLETIGQWPGVQELSVEIEGKRERALHYLAFSEPVQSGQTVWLNTSAVRLQLGTGGYHFVIPIPSGDIGQPARLNSADPELGHIMKLRYTPCQFSVVSCEESDHPLHSRIQDKDSLEGMPVVAAELHSMLPAITGVVHYLALNSIGKEGNEIPVPKVAYIMTDGGALPAALSRTLADLKKKGLLCGIITTGNAFGGDLEAVNLYSGLLAAKYILHADLAIAAMGPGVTGTGSKFGHTGIEQGQVLNAVASLQGVSIACPRISFADPRPRHQGISHHTLTVLDQVALARAIVPVPILESDSMQVLLRQIYSSSLAEKHELRFLDGSIVTEAAAYYNLQLSTMGRGLEQDPAYFLAAGASGAVAWEELLKAAR